MKLHKCSLTYQLHKIFTKCISSSVVKPHKLLPVTFNVFFIRNSVQNKFLNVCLTNLFNKTGEHIPIHANDMPLHNVFESKAF